MSFKCVGCNKTAAKPVRVVKKVRLHKHTQTFIDDRGFPMLVETGVGNQIVEEANLCGSCAGR